MRSASHAKVRMRRTVRGLRAIEQEILSEQRTPEPPSLPPPAFPAGPSRGPGTRKPLRLYRTPSWRWRGERWLRRGENAF